MARRLTGRFKLASLVQWDGGSTMALLRWRRSEVMRRKASRVAGNGDGRGGEKLGCCCGASAGDGGGRKMEMVSAAQCGRVLGALRHALAWLGRTG